MQDKLEFVGFIIFLKLFKILPYSLAEKLLAKIFVWGGYYLGIRRRVAEQNLQMVYPEMSNQQRKKILKKMYYHLGITSAETYLANFKKLVSKTSFKGKENIEKALSLQKGVIITTGHFGNWELAGRVMALHWPMSVVIKKQHNKYFNDYTNKIREQGGMKIIYKKRALRGILKYLKQNYLVCLLIDQNARKNGMKMDFLGKPAPVFIGAAKISIKTQAPIVPAVIIRKHDGSHSICYEEPIFPTNYQNNMTDIKKYTKEINSSLENYINQYPEQWFWVHRRWREPNRARR